MPLDDDTAFSRSGSTGAGGKLTARLDIPVSEELEDAVITLATMAGVGKAEFVRRLLERSLFGELSCVRRVSRGAMGGQWEESPTGIGSRT